MPPHFVEKPDLKPLFASYSKVDGEPSEELVYTHSKAFISDSRYRGKIRFRDLIDPRYLKKHGLTDKDLAYEIGDNTGLLNYKVADDRRTVLFVVDARGGGRELIVVRWVLHEGHLYLSPAPPDPKTGIFKLWILRTKLIETKQSPQPVPSGKQPDKPSRIVENPDMKGRMPSGLPSGATEDGAVVVKSFFAKMLTYPDIRFREFFDPRYLKKHGLADRDIAFEIADHQGIASLHVADDNLTVLVTLDVKGGGREAFVMRCVVYDGHIYISPEKAPDPKTGIFTPWILRTNVK